MLLVPVHGPPPGDHQQVRAQPLHGLAVVQGEGDRVHVAHHQPIFGREGQGVPGKVPGQGLTPQVIGRQVERGQGRCTGQGQYCAYGPVGG